MTDTSSVLGILTQPSEWASVTVIFEGLTTADATVSAPPTTHRVCSPLSCTSSERACAVSIHLHLPVSLSLLENFLRALEYTLPWRLGRFSKVYFIAQSNNK